MEKFARLFQLRNSSATGDEFLGFVGDAFSSGLTYKHVVPTVRSRFSKGREITDETIRIRRI